MESMETKVDTNLVPEKFLYRPHRHLLEESMREVQEIRDWNHLVELVGHEPIIEDRAVWDSRVGWNTHYVCVRLEGYEHPCCIGMCNFSKEMIDEKSKR